MPWVENKVVLYSGCRNSNLGDPRSWVHQGSIIEIPQLNPPDDGSGRNNPEGAAQPRAIYQNGTIYVSFLYDGEPGGLDPIVARMAVSTDGVNFTHPETSSSKRSNMTHGLSKSNSPIGHQWGSLLSDYSKALQPADPRNEPKLRAAYSLDIDSYLFFSKDLGNVGHHSLVNQYKFKYDEYVIQKDPEDATGKLCSAQPGFMTTPEGFVDGGRTYVYDKVWEYNFYCHCLKDRYTGFGAGKCDHGLEDNNTFSISDSDVSVIEVIFDFTETDCIGNRYSSCEDGACMGVQRVRSCTAENTWSDWTALE